MGRFRGMATLVAGVLAASAVATIASTAGAVPAKVAPGTDPCTVLTQADLAGLSTTYTMGTTSSELDDECTYELAVGDSTTPLQLTVESSIGYTAQKAVTKGQKKISGLPGGYTGTINGGNEAAYKSGKAGVLLQDSDLSSADLAKILKSIHKRLG